MLNRQKKRNMREINLNIFERKGGNEILFQPRIEWWYQWNKAWGTLPEKYRKMSLMELFDDLGVSFRYFEYYTGLPSAVGVKYTKEIKIKERERSRNERNVITNTIIPSFSGLPMDLEVKFNKRMEIRENEKYIIISTPKGEMIQKEKRLSSDGSWRITEFPIKSAEDLEKAGEFFKNVNFVFIKDNFEKGDKFVTNRGEPQFFFPRSPYQMLSLFWMGTENLIYALADVPEKVEKLMRVIDNCYETLCKTIVSYGKVKIINFGENIDANIISPYYFEKYCIPFYKKRTEQLRKAGIYTHIHIDGNFKPLLKYLKDLPFDGLEALTPLPQGDVSIEEIKESIGDKILLDGIPAIMFLPNYPLEELKAFTRRVIELFHPRLILGVSDEVPPPADIERVACISQYCRSFKKCNNCLM